jgi:hypothetical protein
MREERRLTLANVLGTKLIGPTIEVAAEVQFIAAGRARPSHAQPLTTYHPACTAASGGSGQCIIVLERADMVVQGTEGKLGTINAAM